MNVLGSVLKAIFLVLGMVFLATILEWCGMHSWWQSVYDSRLSERTLREMQQIETSVGVAFDQHWFRNTRSYTLSISDRLVLPIERYLEAQRREFDTLPTSMSAVTRAVVRVQQSLNSHLTVAVEVFQACIFRLTTFLFGIVSVSPLLLVGLTHGLVNREIRRWRGGRESAWLYVFASKSLFPTITLFIGIYVLWPWTFTFAWINSAMGIVLSCALSLALATFKKYL